MGEKKEETKVKGAEKKNETKKEGGEKKSEESNPIVLKLDLHCEGCAKKVRRFIRHLEGVKEVTSELEKDLVTVKGTMDTKELTSYLADKLKRNIEVVPPKKDNGSSEKKGKEGDNAKKEKESGGGGGDQKEKEGNGEKKDGESKGDSEVPLKEQKTEVINKLEYHGYNPDTYYAMPMQKSKSHGPRLWLDNV